MKKDRNLRLRFFVAFGWLILILFAGFFVFKKFEGELTLGIVHWELALVGLIAGTVSSIPMIVIIRDYILKPGTAHRYTVSFILAFVPAIAKYIPGKIWSVAGFLHQAKSLAGVSVKDATFSQVYLQIVGLISSSILSLVGLLFAGLLPSKVPLRTDLIIGVLFLLLAGGGAFLALSRVASKLGHQIEGRNIPRHLWIFSLQKILKGVSLFLFICAYLPAQGHLLEIVLAFIISMQLGTLAFFAPAGLGVMEGAYVLLLSGTVSTASALSIAVIARIWQSGIDFLLALIGFCLKYVVTRISESETTRYYVR